MTVDLSPRAAAVALPQSPDQILADLGRFRYVAGTTKVVRETGSRRIIAPAGDPMLSIRRKTLAGCCGGRVWLAAAIVRNSGAGLDEQA